MTVTCHMVAIEDLEYDPIGNAAEFLELPRVGEYVNGYGTVVEIIHYPKTRDPDPAFETPMIQLYLSREPHANRTKGQKRPADVIGNAVKIARIATGEDADDLPDDGKDKAAQALGKKGRAARAASMTTERRAEIAKKAAAKRWGR